jgi:hypothetical protein
MSRGFHEFRFSFVLILLACLSSSPATGTTWTAPQEPLSPRQWLEFDLSGADAVGIGRLVAVRDTVVDVSPVDSSGIPVRSLTLRVAKWLKGGNGEATIRVGISLADFNRSFEPQSQPALFMLRRYSSGWGLCDGPDPGGAGLRSLADSEVAATQRTVTRILEDQSVDSLLTRADVVVVGRWSFSRFCATGSKRRCVVVAVDSVLAGTVSTDSLCVFMPFLAYAPPGQGLYVLRASPEGYHETIGYLAGGQAVIDGRTQRWGISVETLRQRLRHLRPQDLEH